MIFEKESSFPYPILSKFTEDYLNSVFSFEVSLEDGDTQYTFYVKYQLESPFLTKLLLEGNASLFLVIQSKDNKFFELTTNSVSLPKNRISLNKRTLFQLFIMSKSDIIMEENLELDPFYDNIKKHLKIHPYQVLAMSNVERFNGDLRKPFNLFEKRVDPKIASDIKIELSSEMIVIVYKDKELQYGKFRNSRSLNNHYVYIGLQKALMQFILEEGENNNEVYINNISDPEKPLHMKLHRLLKHKKVNLLSLENIDEVIAKISDRIIQKHFLAIEETLKYDHPNS